MSTKRHSRKGSRKKSKGSKKGSRKKAKRASRKKTTNKATYNRRLTKFYGLYAPHKLAKVAHTLGKWEGREEKLFRALQLKYKDEIEAYAAVAEAEDSADSLDEFDHPDPEPTPAVSATKQKAVDTPPKKAGKQFFENDRHFVEKFDHTAELKVVVKHVKEAVYVGQLQGTSFKKAVCVVEGKCKTMTINGCVNAAVVFDTTVGNVELINCQRVDVQCNGGCPIFVIDGCDRTNVYISAPCAKTAEVLSAKSSSVNFYVADGDDQVEVAIPEQIETRFDGGLLPVSFPAGLGEDVQADLKAASASTTIDDTNKATKDVAVRDVCAESTQQSASAVPADTAEKYHETAQNGDAVCDGDGMEQSIRRLEAVALRLGGGGGDDGGVSPAVSLYHGFYQQHVIPFIEAINRDAEMQAHGTWAETAFTHLGVTIEAASQCAAPTQEVLMDFVAPIVKVVTESGNPARGDHFNHGKAFAEVMASFNWMFMPGGGKAFILNQREAATMWLNKVLMAAKEQDSNTKDNWRLYVRSLKELMEAYADYVGEFATTGLAWKINGEHLATWTAGENQGPSRSSAARSPMERLTAVLDTLERYSAKRLGGGDGPPLALTEYEAFAQGTAAACVAACRRQEALTPVAEWLEACLTNIGDCVAKTFECAKPSDADLLKFLEPVSAASKASQNPRACKDRAFDSHYRAAGEVVTAMQWIMMPSPKGHISAQLDATDMYLNRILMAAKDQPDPKKSDDRAFVRSIKEMLTELSEFSGEHFKTGLLWKHGGTALI